MDISQERREYLRAGLSEEHLRNDPIEQFRHWLKDAIDAEISTDPTAMCLSTVGADGRPSQRIVLLKQFDEKGFVFYTNLESKKAKQIAENPNVCLHFGWLPLERQIIINGTANKLSVTEATKYFLSRPRDSQLAAWASQQSQKISSRQLLEQAFSQMKSKFTKGDIPLPSFWGGFRVVPEQVEFWQGRANRLHDRLVYSQSEAGWSIERLQP
ncbi:pyridoxamine 5'-phosphate oxidase [Endozoicomonas sp. SM1973]|uniref:Pyridoxine/pyridoxamine 5'-phosphate oxidase n=1 Tax=Spartinivicinus marinus TaxID=2994442 RepID=A0A853IH41_9GAMM|nr:pyridoxamine 5'-phosphate oxidase [Spartinivicinus marinus]MCX4026514.1 pyridoxamine 5'-phosphate oxidase [Spartinivicinus marinus]NYZ66886.1 pyridoxamine 5'-phosphate oxidase [Spartinivicinus marinus]